MSTQTTLAQADLVVIGAGIMGAAIAYQLNRQSERRIVVIDERPPVGGMSGRTFGQIRLHYSNALMLQLAMRGYEVLDNWSREVGYGDPGYVPMGYLLIVVEAQLEALHRNIDLARSLGIDTRFVGPDEIKAIEPAIETGTLAGGAYDPAGGYIDVTRMVLSWLGSAQENGVRLISGLRAEAIETANGKVTGVSTARGLIEAPLVISATGPWGRELLSPLGIDLPLEARRLDMMYMRQPPNRAQIGCCITDGNSNVGHPARYGARPTRRRLSARDAPHGRSQRSPQRAGRSRPSRTHCQGVRRTAARFLRRQADPRDQRNLRHHPGLAPGPGLGARDRGPLSGGRLLGARIEALARDRRGRGRHGAGQGARPRHPPLRFERFAEGEPMFLAYGPGARA